MSAAPEITHDGNVTRIERDGRVFHIVGTAHISEKSVEEVREVIGAVRPDSVAVELCSTRYEALTDASRWRNLDIFSVIKQRKVLFLLANLALSSYQRRMGEALGVKPGAELLAACDSAKTAGAELVLADRDIQATLKRTWFNLSFLNKMRLLGGLMESFFSDEQLTEEDLERLKERQNLSEIMQEFARAMPQVQVPLIDERDRYLASTIRESPGDTVVAVVGAGHVEGITRYFDQEIDRDVLAVIPPPGRLVRALKWVIPTLVLMAFWFGYQKHQGEGLKEMVFAWVLPNSIMAALFSAIAGARVLSIIGAFVASPITSLNPTIGAGMVVGLLEAWLRKPTVEDAERIPEDTASLKGFYRNPFLRVLLVAAAATLGSAAGAWVGAAWVATLL
jgi:pheromone shutdown-related protein TraB